MFYRKNVAGKERIARLLGGALMLACGLIGLQASALGLVVAAAGAVSVLTGFVGYCPAFAMMGRKPLASE